MLRRTLLSLLVSSCLLACSDAAGPGNGVAGTWRLQTVNGLALPFTLSENGTDKLELTGEVITLVAPRSLNIVTTFRVTEGSSVFPESIPDEGTYAVNGSTVTLTWESDGSTSTAVVSGNTMTLNDIGLTFVYRRD
jgi:hypothetical protein